MSLTICEEYPAVTEEYELYISKIMANFKTILCHTDSPSLKKLSDSMKDLKHGYTTNWSALASRMNEERVTVEMEAEAIQKTKQNLYVNI